MSLILDDMKNVAGIDREGMCKIAERFPEQCEDAIKVSKTLMLPKEVKISNTLLMNYGKARNILVVGMGGSAIVGNLLKDWLRKTLPIPIEVCRSYHLPAYADRNTLVLTVSYSGNTEETLSAYLEAVERGCMTISFTSGGLLQEFSEELGVPLVRLPKGYPPRSAIAYLFFPLVSSLEKLKLIGSTEEVNEAVTVVAKLRDEIKSEIPISLNPSKKIAMALEGSIPFICGFDFYESIALRLKTQFNENSKTLANVEFFPELNHNEIVGWTGLKDLTKRFSVILIRDRQEEAEIKTRIDMTRRLVFDKGAKNVLEIQARGLGKLARMLSAMYIGDFASIYLAILYRTNPTTIKVIEELKKHLGEKTNKNRKLREKVERLKTG